MDRRSVLTVAGVVVVVGVVVLWLTMRPDGSEAVTGQARAPEAAVATASGSLDDPVPPDSAGRTAANPPDASAEAAALQAVAAPSPQAVGEALPIDVSPGFEHLNKPAAEMKDTDFNWPHWRQHQILQSEPRDPEWAPRMEAALRSGIQGSLTARGLDTQRIELPVIECRTTGCEIQAVGYPEDNMKEGADLQLILPMLLPMLLRGNLGSEFDLDAQSGHLSSRPDGRLTTLVLLPRKKS